MNRSKMMIAAALVMSALLLGGCATALLGPNKTADTASAGATSSEDPATVVVAEVNGEKLYKDAFNEIYDSLMYQYTYSGQDTSSDEAVSSIKKEALDELVNDKIRDQKMAELGYSTLTEEELAQAEADMMEYLIGYIDAYYLDDVIATLEEGYTDEELQAAKEAYVDTLLTTSGITREEFVKNFQDQVANDKALKAEKGDIVPTDEEVKAKYDEYVAADQTAIEADPASYISSANSGTVYYVPEGVRLVRHVLISLDDETVSALDLLRSEGYDAAADVVLQNGLSAIEARAKEALSRIDIGEITFEEAIAQYSGDPGQPEEGYPVMTGTDAYQDAFTEGAMGLAAVGEHTGLIATDYGYHIIEYYEDVPAGPVSYDLVKDAISEELQTTMQAEALDEMLAQWREDANVVTYEQNL